MASSSSSTSSSSTTSNSPCAACKFLRRKCMPGCIFAPYFPPEEPQKFASVHKVFGASNVTKLLNDLLPHQREDAVNSLAYEAEARMKDPVYGCVGAISVLQRQVHRLQKELDAANADLLRYACGCADINISNSIPTGLPLQQTVVPSVGFGTRNNIAYPHPMATAASTAAMTGPPIAYSLQWAAAAAAAAAAAGESRCNNGDQRDGGDQSSM